MNKLYIVGKVTNDHFRPNGSSRDFNNIYNLYGAFKNDQPVKGEDVAFIMVSYDKKKRTNAVFSKWVGK